MEEKDYIKGLLNGIIPDLSNLLEKAFEEGYRKGKLDARPSVTVDGVEYFDLNLPSGTLWSTAPQSFAYGWYLNRLTYEDAKKLGLPTKEQWEELLEHCDVVLHAGASDGKTYGLPAITGPNGQRLGYPMCKNDSKKYITYTLGEQCEKGKNKFWLLSEPDERHHAEVVVFDKDVLEYDTHFIGYKLPFFLVKKKDICLE